MINIHRSTLKSLSQIFLIALTGLHISAAADQLLLQCDVKGTFSSSIDSAPTQLTPTTVLVKIEYLDNYIYMDIDGPDDYAMGLSSASYERWQKILRKEYIK